MDESGGSGQPRSGTDEATEHPAVPDATTAHPRSDADAADRTTRPDSTDSTTSNAPSGTVRWEKPAAATRPSDTTGNPPASPPADTTDSESADDPVGTPAAEQPPAAETADVRPESLQSPESPEGPADSPVQREAVDERAAAAPAAAQPPGTTGHGRDSGVAQASPRGDEPGKQRRDGAGGDPDGRPQAGGRGPRPPRRGKEPGGGLLMGRPFGVPVYVAPSWFLVAALITWVFGGQLDRVLPELGAARYLVSLFFAVAFYASVLVHELAHTVAALRFKLPVRRIQLQFFGGVSEIEKESETPGREFVLAFVGPLLSLVLAGLFYLALMTVEPGTVPGVLLAGLMISNLIVAVFNLLPGLPLDGGRMLRAVVWKITGRPMTGTIAAAWVGRALAISVLIGLPLLTQSGALGTDAEDIGGMDTVTDALLAAILAAIIWTGAGNSLRMARLREHLPELRARSLTRRAVPVQTDTPLSEALRRANDVGARALVVVDADGEPVSLVREAAIVGVPEHRRPWVAVSGLAQELTDGMRVSAELAGEALLDVLRATPATEYLVVEESGEIYGVLSAADVERAFVKAMARPN
ncbi:site-2 protease family protein [Streptomyces sporangiiformans]|uniref:Peptidase n=1 Tax=Streptomyces sporangiiformans TaxID=2315329 RepID=A0A505DD61_9ACTN|nr:site-2 protease family protein [Streptomyces sporangiiformans]TPQ20462.1 peptidase [Streptomyces sporangiiformans]